MKRDLVINDEISHETTGSGQPKSEELSNFKLTNLSFPNLPWKLNLRRKILKTKKHIKINFYFEIMAQSGSKTLKLFCLMIYLSSILNSFKSLEFFYGGRGVDERKGTLGIKSPPQPNANNGNFSPAFALNG